MKDQNFQISLEKLKRNKNIQKNIQMISESFLRNYSLKKILRTAAIQKEKLKVYYTRNIKQIFKNNNKFQTQTNRPKRKPQQSQVFYRYTVNNVKSEVFKDKSNFDEQFYYRGKPKTLLKHKEMKFDKQKESEENKNLLRQRYLKYMQLIENIQLNREQSSVQLRQSKISHDKTYRKTVGNFKKNNYLQSRQTNSKNQINSGNKFSQFIKPSVDKICLQNSQILKYTTSNFYNKTDNFLVVREQQLKKSVERGQKLKKILRKKYANIAVSKMNFTQIPNSSVKQA